MKIYDQHVHSSLSFDSEETFENYLIRAQNLGLTHFVTTEHVDLSCAFFGKDMLVDFDLQERLMAHAQKKYDIQILKGVELGYKFARIKDMESLVAANNFDVVLMSVHEDAHADCTTQGFLANRTAAEAYDAYLDLYIEMLQHCRCYDIVGHIDYLLRYIGKISPKAHEEKLMTLLKLVIKQEKSLECNTRFLYDQKESSYLRFIFQLYHALGGKKVSLGSDAHTAQAFYGGFDEALVMLKDIGFTHICTYQQRQEKALAF